MEQVGVIGGLLLNAMASYDQHEQAVRDADRAIREQAMHVSFWSDRVGGRRAFHLLNSSPDPVNAVSVVFRVAGRDVTTARGSEETWTFYWDSLNGLAPCTELIWPFENLRHNGAVPSDGDMFGKGVRFQDRSGRVWLQHASGVLRPTKIRPPEDWADLGPNDEWGTLQGQPISRKAAACSTS